MTLERNQASIIDTLRDVARHAGRSDAEIDLATSLIGLEFDSLQWVEVSVLIQRKLGFDLIAEALHRNPQTVGDLCEITDPKDRDPS